jgi:hypothetical protein
MRQQRLHRLAGLLRRLREDLGRVREETRNLLATEQIRPLTGGEGARARALRSEGERLWWELQSLRQDFELLRGTHPREG